MITSLRISVNHYNVASMRMMTKIADPNIYYINVLEQHPKTQEVAIKHCNHYKRYSDSVFLPQHTVDAFQEAKEFIDSFYKDHQHDKKHVILDSGCGRGMSSIKLAAKYPNLPVIGIDRSIHRLTKNNAEYLSPQKLNELLTRVNIDNNKMRKYNNNDEDNDEEDNYEEDDDEDSVDTSQHPNVLLIQAELATFWMLAATRSDWIIEYHYLLYPNPYPKSKHLKRRWHGHPVFPALLALGGNLVVRSNWPIYCDEVVSAIRAIDSANALPGLRCNVDDAHQIPFPDEINSMSHFERKYVLANVPLFEATADLHKSSLQERLTILQASED